MDPRAGGRLAVATASDPPVHTVRFLKFGRPFMASPRARGQRLSDGDPAQPKDPAGASCVTCRPRLRSPWMRRDKPAGRDCKCCSAEECRARRLGGSDEPRARLFRRKTVPDHRLFRLVVLQRLGGRRAPPPSQLFRNPNQVLTHKRSDRVSRHSRLYSSHFKTLESDRGQRQERQIVQSQLNLHDYLPVSRPLGSAVTREPSRGV